MTSNWSDDSEKSVFFGYHSDKANNQQKTIPMIVKKALSYGQKLFNKRGRFPRTKQEMRKIVLPAVKYQEYLAMCKRSEERILSKCCNEKVINGYCSECKEGDR